MKEYIKRFNRNMIYQHKQKTKKKKKKTKKKRKMASQKPTLQDEQRSALIAGISRPKHGAGRRVENSVAIGLKRQHLAVRVGGAKAGRHARQKITRGQTTSEINNRHDLKQ
jgi:hypothetical protein